MRKDGSATVSRGPETGTAAGRLRALAPPPGLERRIEARAMVAILVKTALL